MPRARKIVIWAFALSLIASVASNIYLGIYLFDTILSLDHARSQQDHLEEQKSDALAVMNSMATEVTRESVLVNASALDEQKYIVKEVPNGIQIGYIIIVFEEDGIGSIRYLE